MQSSSTASAATETADSASQEADEGSIFCGTCTLIMPLTLLAAILCGLSLGAPGPTLLAIEHSTNSREDQAVLLFAGRAVGAFCGALLGQFLADFVSPRTLIGVGLATSSVGNAMVPACEHIWSMMPAFAVQGFGIYLCLSAVWATVRHRCEQLRFGDTAENDFDPTGYLTRRALLACLAAGMLAAPLVTAPFAQPSLHDLVPGNATVLAEHKPIDLPGVRVRRFLIHSATGAKESTTRPTPKPIGTFLNSSIINSTLHSHLNYSTFMTLSPTLPTTPPPPPPSPKLSKKPGLADGKHLDQSSAVADGSKHGRVLKLHKEQQRLGSINKAAAATHVASPDLSTAPTGLTPAQLVVQANKSFVNQSVTNFTNGTSEDFSIVSNSTTRSSSVSIKSKTTRIIKPRATVTMTTVAMTTQGPLENDDSIEDQSPAMTAIGIKTTASTPYLAKTTLPMTTKTVTTESIATTQQPTDKLMSALNSTSATPKLIPFLSDIIAYWRHLTPLFGVYAALSLASMVGALLAGLCALLCWRRPYSEFPPLPPGEALSLTTGSATIELDDDSLVSVSPEQAAFRLCLFVAAFCLHSLEVTLGCYLFSYSIRYLHLTVLSGLMLVCLLYGGLLVSRTAAVITGLCVAWTRSYRFQLAVGSALLCCGVVCLWPWGTRWLWLASVLTGSGLALLLPALEDACDVWLLPPAAAAAAAAATLTADTAVASVTTASAPESTTSEISEDSSDHDNNGADKELASPLQQHQQQLLDARRCAGNFLTCGQLTGEMLVPAFTGYLHRVVSSPLVLVHVTSLLACSSLLAIVATCYVGWSLFGSRKQQQQQQQQEQRQLSQVVYQSLAQEDNEDIEADSN